MLSEKLLGKPVEKDREKLLQTCARRTTRSRLACMWQHMCPPWFETVI